MSEMTETTEAKVKRLGDELVELDVKLARAAMRRDDKDPLILDLALRKLVVSTCLQVMASAEVSDE